MRPGFDLDGGAAAATGGAFFLCTETWPRCFVIKQVSDIDGALKEVQQQSSPETQQQNAKKDPNGNKEATVAGTSSEGASSSSSSSAQPYLPMLPWWFTAECRQHLLSVPAPEDLHHRALTPETRPPSSIGGQPMSHEQLRARLAHQLEYYFSRENLINDRYLRCQMDADQYVPIKIVANFPKVANLSKDLELIVDVLKSSKQVQVDESGTKVRPMSKRCTIILREIPQNADENEVKSMFESDGCPPYQSLAYGLNDSWYVTFITEEETQKAFFHLQTLGKTFNGKPVFARIKTGGAPIGADLHTRQSPDGQIRLMEIGNLRGQIIVHDPAFPSIAERATPSPQQNGTGGTETAKPFNLGQLLAQYGYVPRATFRPHVPAPAAPVMPPLQPTTGIVTAAGIGAHTSYFAQPILHNGFHHDIRPHRHFGWPPFPHPLQRRAPQPLKITPPEFDILPYENMHLDRCLALFITNGDADDEEDDDGTECADSVNNSVIRDCPSVESGLENVMSANCSPSSSTVGQNEAVLRQLAKENGRAASPVLVPSPVPRITDVPRINGKGAQSPANNTSSNINTTSGRHSPPLSSGAGFAGFQRQESVEAYQIALAANGVAKQKRLSKEDKEEKAESGGRLNKAVGSGRGSLSKSTMSRTASSDQAPPRILGSHGPRRSEPASHPIPLRPLNESFASTNWRQPSVKQQSSPTVPSSVTFHEFRSVPRPQNYQQNQQQHQSHQNVNGPVHVPPQLGRAQPLLSLGQALSTLNQAVQQQHQQQQQYHQMHHQQQHGQHQQQMAPLTSGQQRGPPYDNRKPVAQTDRSYRGGTSQGYRSRTWTSDWPRGSQQSQHQNQHQGSQGFQPARDARGSGQFGQAGHWQGRGGGRGGAQPRMRRNCDGNGCGNEEQEQSQHSLQQHQNAVENQQHKGEHKHFVRPERPPPHFGPPPHFRHEQRQRSNTTSATMPAAQRRRDHSDSDSGPGAASQQNGGGQKQLLLKAGEQPTGYNFEEHVAEFPALSLSQSNSRKASECHGEQAQPLILLEEPVANAAETPSEHSKLAFSAVVAGSTTSGGRPRRATIGTTGTAQKSAFRAETEGNDEKCEDLVEEKQPQRSGTVSGAPVQQLMALASQGQQRSYAQMLKKGGKSSSGGTAKESSSCSTSVTGTEV